MFEIHVGELRATFLRNHNMRRHKDPKRKTTQAEDNSSPEDPRNPHIPGNHHKHGGTAPDMGHCTRYVALHPNRRGALPTDRVQCPNKQEQTRNWHTETLTGTPLHAQLGPTGGRMGTPPTPPPALRPTPAHSGPIRHLLHPYMRRAGFRVRPLGCRSRGDLEGPRDAEVAPLAQEVITPPEGKHTQRVRQPRQLDIRSATAV